MGQLPPVGKPFNPANEGNLWHRLLANALSPEIRFLDDNWEMIKEEKKNKEQSKVTGRDQLCSGV